MDFLTLILAQEDFKQVLDKDWYGQTTLHPVGLAAVVLLGLAMVIVPRRFAILPMIVMACFIAPAQRIVVGGFDFDLLRIMLLFGWARLLIRGELRAFEWKFADWLMIALAIVGSVTYVMLYESQAALTNRLGWSYELLGTYFLFRFLVRDWRDLEAICVGFAIVSIPVAGFFLIELATGRNLFSVLGGVPSITQIRGSRLRCQGAFAHPILAGTFWAAVIPLMASLWWRDPRKKTLAVAGCIMACLIIIACSSSTPVMGAIFVLVGAGMFFFRHWMSMIFWGGLAFVVILDFIMNKPVYHLIARINIFSSSTGWHRYHLIHQSVQHFEEWAWLGTPSTAHWGLGLYDVTNQYVLMGVRGGIATLIIFVVLLFVMFRYVGRMWRVVQFDASKFRLAMAWALGVSLFTHAMAFISVSYFGQIETLWYLLLATIVSLAPSAATYRLWGESLRRMRVSPRGTGLRPVYR